VMNMKAATIRCSAWNCGANAAHRVDSSIATSPYLYVE
jgi:hypothetical protein